MSAKVTLKSQFAQGIATNLASDGAPTKQIVLLVPREWSSHGNSVSGERGISLRHSKLLHEQAQVLLPVGSREFTTHNHLSYKIDVFYSRKSVTDVSVIYLLLFRFSSEICKQ